MKRLLPVCATLALAACGSLDHTNPYDPSTPPALQARARLSGQVALEAGATPPSLAGVHVSIPGTSLAADTDATGAYSIADVPPGSYAVQAVRSGWDDALVSGLVVLLDDGGKDVSVPLLSLPLSRGQLSGAVTLEHELTSGGVTVSLSGLPGSVSTDLSGAFLFSGVPVGSYTLTASKVGFLDTAVTSVDVQKGVVTQLAAVPVPYDPGAFSGAVEVVGAASSGGVTVRASGTTLNGSPYEATTQNRTDGTFLFSGLPAGTYQVSFELANHATVSTSGAVAPGATTTLPPVSLVRDTGSVTGTVALSAGAAAGFPVGGDLSGAVVTLTAPGGAARSTVTDASGAWSFDAVPVSLTGASHALSARRASYLPASGSVTVVAHGSTAASPLTLVLDVGSLAGTVTLWDNVAGGGANGSSAGATVSLVGTAFNGAAWSASTTTAADGSFTAAGLPPGSYDVTATSAGRSCAAFARASVPAGTAATAGSVTCVDAVAPGAVSLGAPVAPSGGLSGYTAAGSVAVPMVEPTDATGNLRGYELVVGSAADWSAATLVAAPQTSLTFGGLAANATNLLWVRAVDWAGNPGPVASAQVVHDGVAPPAPTISTPRPVVDATTTSVTLSDSDADANFGGYEICTVAQDAATDCAATSPGGCAWDGTSPGFALSLAAGQRTCLYARAWDRAGTRSAESALVGGVIADLVAPTPPGFVPSFDPQLVTVRAPWVDFFLDSASTDLPAGGAAWSQVAWVEVDSGSGFEPLCPAAACHPGGTYSPCAPGCGCFGADRRLLCDGTRFAGVRVPLREGSSNDVAFRSVDLAGNVGSGVGQQVRADSSGDVIAGSVALEGSPVVRGNLVTFDSWIPGLGNPHGVILELGPDRRAQTADLRCDVPGSVASGYGRGIVPTHPGLVLVADNTGVMLRPDGAGHYCSAAGAWVGTAATFRTPPAGFFVRGVSGVGELGAWWEDDFGAAIADVYVREPGPDRAFGSGDDVVTRIARLNYVETLTTGDRGTLVKHASCNADCFDFRWRIYNANASDGYASGVTTWDLPAATTTAALSPDGRQVLWWEPAGADPQRLGLRSSGANELFEVGGDDGTAFTEVPAAWGVPARTTSAESSLAVDGTHAIALLRTDSLNTIAHWWAGPDGKWGTGDDTLERIHPTAGSWGTASLSAGYAVFGEAFNIRAVDLSYLRWEVTPAAGLSQGMSLAADGTGQLLYRTSGSQLRARTLAGADVAGFTHFGLFDVLGDDLLTAEGSDLVLRRPGTSGTWFTAGAPPPATLFAGTGTGFRSLALGGGKAIAVESVGSNAYRFRILEPQGGTLATLPTTGAVVDALGIDQGWADAAGITARQAFYTCHGIATDLCLRNAGADGWFGTGDDTSGTLLHPSGSPRAGLAVHDARAFEVAGRLMLLAEFSPPALYLFETGPDGLFGTADDRGRKLADGFFSPFDVALAGRSVAYVAEGSPMGAQIWLVSGFDGSPTLVTGYVSPKTSLAIEPSGRVFWADSVFAPEAVFVRAP